jgi:hypothetical protein
MMSAWSNISCSSIFFILDTLTYQNKSNQNTSNHFYFSNLPLEHGGLFVDSASLHLKRKSKLAGGESYAKARKRN